MEKGAEQDQVFIEGSNQGWETLFESELAYTKPWRDQTKHEKDSLTGLALSGGGIRSATFSLGIMQALASRDLLKQFDYLSTVSGGGYIGSSLTWLVSRKGDDFGTGPNDFPYGTDDPKKLHAEPEGESSANGTKMLRFLRQHGNYLTPGKCITLSSAIAVVLRGLATELLFWGPLLVGLLIALLLPQWHLEAFGHKTPGVYALVLALSAAGGALFVFMSAVYSLITRFDWWLGSLRYVARRAFECVSGYLLFFIIALAVVGSLPYVSWLLGRWVSESASLSTVLGLVSGLVTFMRNEDKPGAIPTSVVAAAGAMLLVYGIAVLAYQLATIVPLDHRHFACAGLLAFGVLFGWFCNLNLVTLHRFYRDRLMEAYLPDVKMALADDTGAARQADKAYIQKVWGGESPYPILNSIAVLVDSGVRKYRTRSGDAFMLSPLYCGSRATGWLRSDKFLKGKLSLATAVAISGAAVNPNAEAFRVTRNAFVSLLMNLLNLRLGYWVHNPRKRLLNSVAIAPNHILPGLYEVGGGFRENKAFLQLSDGGNFDNLGMYELVRRRARLIVVCDGGADPDYTFVDLRRACRLIEQDFGAIVDIANDPTMLDPLMPKARASVVYPDGVKIADQGYIVGEIRYPDVSWNGTLVYLNTTMVPELSLRTMGYWGSHRDFPDQSTADQFFDEDQFEAYRELGYRIGITMIDGANLADCLQFPGG